jgi:integrase/recombinase XerC
MTDGRRSRAARAGVAPELATLVDGLASGGLITGLSQLRVSEVASRLASFLEAGYGVCSLGDATPQQICSFIVAGGTNGLPSVSTMHLRRSVVRLLYREARRSGLVVGDPTVDLVLPARSDRTVRPLVDFEMELCRHASLHSLHSTRLSAPLALAEATARTTEIPHIRISDLDLGEGRVWIHGATRTEPRWGELTDWGLLQLHRHVERMASASPATPLTRCGHGSATLRPASASRVLREVLARAGLSDDDLGPVSVPAWRGRSIYELTGRIDEVARRLGMRSLDRAARLIDLQWQSAANPSMGEREPA